MSDRAQSIGLVIVYLAAIVTANLTVAAWGPDWSVINAFFLVGLVLTTRDRLHDLFAGHRLRNMTLLILGGSAIAYGASVWLADDAIPSDVVARIALASAVAFGVAESWDAITYHLLRRQEWLVRSNASNVIGAAFDSVLFVWIAFGWSWGLTPGTGMSIAIGQFTAKVAGGFLWSLVLRTMRERSAERAAAKAEA